MIHFGSNFKKHYFIVFTETKKEEQMKLKEQILKQQEQQMIHMSKFFDYLYDNVIKADFINEKIDEMERNNSIHSDVVIGSLSNKSIKTANNSNYNPKIKFYQGVNHGKQRTR